VCVLKVSAAITLFDHKCGEIHKLGYKRIVECYTLYWL